MRIFPAFIFLVSATCTFAQVQNTLLNHSISLQYENSLPDTNRPVHTSIKPFLKQDIKPNLLADSLEPSGIRLPSGKTRIHFTPLANIQYLYELNKSTGNMLMEGGLNANADFGKRFSLSATFLTCKSEFVSYQDSIIKNTDVIPGIGTAYGKDKYSYQQLSGYLSFSPNKIFNFQIGKDKHFFGDGYRSLFLSDISSNYLFGKISTTVWKIKYVNLYAFLKDTRTASHQKKDFKNKFATFHYLSWNATKKLNFSLFESIVWQGTDTSRARGFDVNYLNPVIFYRPVEYSLGSSDNAFLGLSFKWNVFKKYNLYGQLLLDEFLLKEIKARNGWWANKYGIQAGLKCFDLFKIKNLTLQAELNYVRPYTYSHASVQQNYGHFNQALAHPLGANFSEALSILTYHYKRFTLQGKLVMAKYGVDSSTTNNIGQNIYKSYSTRSAEYGHFTGQGISSQLVFADFNFAYLLHKATGLKVEAGASLRMLKAGNFSQNTPFIYFGLKTPLSNFYNDY